MTPLKLCIVFTAPVGDDTSSFHMMTSLADRETFLARYEGGTSSAGEMLGPIDAEEFFDRFK